MKPNLPEVELHENDRSSAGLACAESGMKVCRAKRERAATWT